MKAPPQSTKNEPGQPTQQSRSRSLATLAGVNVRYRVNFAYVDGCHRNNATIKLCRLQYGGSAHLWGLPNDRASHDDKDSYLPTGVHIGTAEDALDCACSLYVVNDTPTNTSTN